jgi:hypothetical protein
VKTVLLPAGWEHHVAPAATLLDGLGPAMLWWAGAAVLLLAGCLLLRSRPRLSAALAVAATLMLGIACNGLVDDAYIQFRYAANLAAGHGPVFNPGERVEGASGGLWIAAIALADRATGADAARSGRVLSILAAVLSTVAAWGFGRATGGVRGGAVAALLWAALPTPALYAATGLETTAFAAALWGLGAAVASGSAFLAGMTGVLGAGLRPEGVVLALAAVLFWRGLSRAGRTGVSSALAASAALACARYLYYGLPVPRSALVKGVTAASGAGAGLAYLGQAAFEWWPLLLILPWTVKQAARLLPVLVPATVWTVLVAGRGGDWMPGGRYLLPVAVILIGAAAVGATDASGTIRRLTFGVTFASVGWGLLLLAPLEPPSPLPAGRAWRAMAEHRVQSRWWEAIGAWLKRSVPPSTLLAAGPVGALPYASGLRTFDMYGLCSKVTRTREGETGHRLWGLREAVDAGADVIYPGQAIPQVEDWKAVMDGALLHLSDVPDFPRRYHPIGIAHAPEYHLDLLRDVIWMRVPRHPDLW